MNKRPHQFALSLTLNSAEWKLETQNRLLAMCTTRRWKEIYMPHSVSFFLHLLSLPLCICLAFSPSLCNSLTPLPLSLSLSHTHIYSLHASSPLHQTAEEREMETILQFTSPLVHQCTTCLWYFLSVYLHVCSLRRQSLLSLSFVNNTFSFSISQSQVKGKVELLSECARGHTDIAALWYLRHSLSSFHVITISHRSLVSIRSFLPPMTCSIEVTH